MKKVLLISLVLIFVSCNKAENKLVGGWIIRKIKYNNQVIALDFSTNAFDLHEDHSCTLPIPNSNTIDTISGTGEWSCYEKNNIIFLSIKTKNTFFDRTFKVSNYTVTRQSGFSPIIKATFQACCEREHMLNYIS
jgi:hypothetical protein